MVAPSHFSTNFQFPGHQMFFKDFILSTENHTVFIEQLKITLTNELIDMNDSTYETLNLSTIAEHAGGSDGAGSGSDDGSSPSGGGDDDDLAVNREYVVKPETLSTLSVLAKFLGFVVARPYLYEFGRNAVVDNRQIHLRNKVCYSLFFSFVCRPFVHGVTAVRKPQTPSEIIQ